MHRAFAWAELRFMLIMRLGRDVKDPLFPCMLDTDRVDPAPYISTRSPSLQPHTYTLHGLFGTVLGASWQVDSVEVPTRLDRVLGLQTAVLLMSWQVDWEAASTHPDHDDLHLSPYASTHHPPIIHSPLQPDEQSTVQ